MYAITRSHTYHQLPASIKVTAIPYKLKPTIKISNGELCLRDNQSLGSYQQGSLLCLIARVRRERAATMQAMEWIKAIQRG